ncbi:MAG TPA: Fur family transcriptional regulator [Rhizomicrobium sp.]|nr:Fur family transcriptional regulator [Rhizomicrobium sp.]
MKNALPRTHDHQSCRSSALEAAEALAASRGVRLTPLRHRVLEIVLESHRPMGAYDVLKELSPERPQPPIVYRALDFLLAQGFVHRIDSLNAYVGCFSPARPHRSHFLLCTRCGRAAEIDDDPLVTALDDAARSAGFAVQRETVEISGICSECRPSSN